MVEGVGVGGYFWRERFWFGDLGEEDSLNVFGGEVGVGGKRDEGWVVLGGFRRGWGFLR